MISKAVTLFCPRPKKMNADLEKLAALVGATPAWVMTPVGDLQMRLSPKGQVLVGVRSFIDHVFGDLAPEDLDRRALKAQLTAPTDRDGAQRIDGVRYRHYGALKAALHELEEGAARSAVIAFPWAELEKALFTAAKASFAGASDDWAARAERYETKAAALRAAKRTFDEAFAATPAEGALTERPPKAARLADASPSVSSAEPSSSAEGLSEIEFSEEELSDSE